MEEQHRRQLYDDLLNAVDSLDKSTITSLCSNNKSIVNEKLNDRNETALHRVCRNRSREKKPVLEVVRLLLVWGADVRIKDRDGCMPVQLAIQNDELEVVMFLTNKDQLSLHYNVHIDLNYIRDTMTTALELKRIRIVHYLKTIIANYKVKAISEEELINNLKTLSSDEQLIAREICSTPTIKNLALQGGGVLGIAYLGALQEMEQNGIMLENIEKVAGTSAGAICSCLIAVGYTVDELHEQMMKFNFENVLDEGNIKEQFLKIVEDLQKGNTGDLLWRLIILLKNFPNLMGLFSGKRFQGELENYIEQKTGNGRITFGELHKLREEKGCKLFKDLYVVSQDLCTSCSTVFSHETSENLAISDCVRASMSIPVLFHPMELSAPGYDPNEKHMFVDGGIGMNFPLTIFDNMHDFMKESSFNYVHNPETIGFRLVDKQLMMHYLDNKQIQANPCPDGLISFVSALYSQQGCAQEMLYQMSDPHHDRTAFIDRLGISFVDFALKKEEVEDLIQSGATGMKSYFERRKQLQLKSSNTDWVVVEDPQVISELQQMNQTEEQLLDANSSASGRCSIM